jgi:hypothetical protein
MVNLAATSSGQAVNTAHFFGCGGSIVLKLRSGPQVASRLDWQSFGVTSTELRPASGDKLADIHSYAIDLETSQMPEEVRVGRNLMMILKGKNK